MTMAASTPDYRVDDNGCWIWQRNMVNGYGAHPQGRAHRIYYEVAKGEIPAGWHVHHICGVRACVNPEHLEALDPRDHFQHHYLQERGTSLEDIREIRRLGRTGVPATEVAERFGILRVMVYRYWNAEVWATELGDGPVFPEPWPCAAPDCDELVIAKRRHKQYCTPRCRTRVNDRKRRARKAQAIATHNLQRPGGPDVA